MTEKTQFSGFMFPQVSAQILVRRGGITKTFDSILSPQHLSQKLR